MSGVVKQAKQALKTEFGGDTASACKKRLAKRLPNGPAFNDTAIGHIETLSRDAEGAAWLDAVGVGTHRAARDYLGAGDYTRWLRKEPGQRVLIASLAWTLKVGRDSPNPPPSFTLGRHMAIGKGGLDAQAKRSAERERDAHIREAFVNTLSPDPSEAAIGASPQDQQRTLLANDILTKIFLLLQMGLKVYAKDGQGGGRHIDYMEGDVARALAHGGRVNIRIPALGAPNANPNALADWLGVTGGGATAPGVRERGFATHRMSIGKNTGGRPGTGRFGEEGGKTASMANKVTSGAKLFGVDVAGGGLGKRDFNGAVILPDGAHGHLFIGFRPPTQSRDGALQVGLETTGPGAGSPVGYQHNWQSTEATANPESSFYGHKSAKIGEGELKTNQRLVDLTRIGPDWMQEIKEFEQEWNEYLGEMSQKGRTRDAYRTLVGSRRGYAQQTGGAYDPGDDDDL